MPANRYTSDSLTVLVMRVCRPTGTSSIDFPLISDTWRHLPPGAARTQSAIHEYGLPRDEARGVGGQEHDHVGNVLWHADAPEWRVVDGRLDALGMPIHIGPRQWSLDDAGPDGVDGHSLRPPLDRQAAHQARQAGLGGRVRGAQVHPVNSADRARDHDPAPRFCKEQWRENLTGHENAIKIGLQHLPERFIRLLECLYPRVDAGFGDQDVELRHSLPDCFQSATLAYISQLDAGQGIFGKLTPKRGDLFFGLADRNHPRALAAQRPDDSQTDTTSAAGDQRGSAVEAHRIAFASTRVNGSRICFAIRSS